MQLLNALLFCILPGLLPFSSEPHIVGKVKWILGGAVGMQPMDYFDTLLHGSPFVYLIIVMAGARLWDMTFLTGMSIAINRLVEPEHRGTLR